jgi:peptidoglycan-associated lipoprotein
MKKIIVCIIVAIISISAYSQNKKIANAYEAYHAGQYYEAIDMLNEAYNLIKDRTEKAKILFYIAECYRNINNPGKAENMYRKALSRDYPDPIAILYYADALKMNEKYEEALEEYKRYKERVPDDPRGENGVKSCRMAMAWIDNPSGYIVENMKYFNSRENDYSPYFARDDYSVVYFTSSRENATGDEQHPATGENSSDIYVSYKDRKGSWSVPVPLDENINSEFEEGAASLSSDYNTMVFTRCELSKSKNMGCAIYESKRNGENWSKAKAYKITSDSLVAAHPALSPDGLTIYFTSDIEGSIGGTDIWYSTRDTEGDEWGEPINMGPSINTMGNEAFPYVHPDGTFYFASNGHIGMGGLDIFKAKKNNAGEWEVENLRYPINSSSDDFGIVFEKEMERGFFSSSRTLRAGDDIFSFYLPPLKFNIIGTVKDEKTNEILKNATVKAVGSDGIQIESQTGEDGTFKFMLKPNTDYVFIASKEGYLNGKDRETTKGLEASKDFYPTIYLTSIDKPIELSQADVFYETGKSELRPEAMVALDRLVEILNDNPSITIELMSHTDYRGTDEYNNKLSQDRAKAVVDYLISKGIAPDRLTAKGYGETTPKMVDEFINRSNPFLRVGVRLTEEYINSLPNEDYKEIANQINRRTEFKVLRTDYKK